MLWRRHLAFWEQSADTAADLTSQANHLGVTIEADIIKQKLPETNSGYMALSQAAGKEFMAYKRLASCFWLFA